MGRVSQLRLPRALQNFLLSPKIEIFLTFSIINAWLCHNEKRKNISQCLLITSNAVPVVSCPRTLSQRSLALPSPCTVQSCDLSLQPSHPRLSKPSPLTSAWWATGLSQGPFTGLIASSPAGNPHSRLSWVHMLRVGGKHPFPQITHRGTGTLFIMFEQCFASKWNKPTLLNKLVRT